MKNGADFDFFDTVKGHMITQKEIRFTTTRRYRRVDFTLPAFAYALDAPFLIRFGVEPDGLISCPSSPLLSSRQYLDKVA